MTAMLASINSLEEAKFALAADVDWIDLKEPGGGALGALNPETIIEIVRFCRGRKPVSATIGDLPMKPQRISEAVMALSKTGVDAVKIGFFPGGDWAGVLQRLSTLSGQKQLIAVLFADKDPDFSIIDALNNFGFSGAMLDTMNKTKGSLTGLMTTAEIDRFVRHVKSRNMLCGLAGSLTPKDVPQLIALQPDYLGFRGALCGGQKRTANLKPELLDAVKQAMTQQAVSIARVDRRHGTSELLI
jgi:uncharacterized protein (UPF0264 family)